MRIYSIFKNMVKRIKDLSPMPSTNILGWQGLTLTQNGSNSFTLVSAYTYLAVITRLNNSSDSYTGVYLIRPYHNSSSTGASSIATIKSASSTTLSISDVTLTASTTTANTSIVLFPLRSV